MDDLLQRVRISGRAKLRAILPRRDLVRAMEHRARDRLIVRDELHTCDFADGIVCREVDCITNVIHKIQILRPGDLRDGPKRDDSVRLCDSAENAEQRGEHDQTIGIEWLRFRGHIFTE